MAAQCGPGVTAAALLLPVCAEAQVLLRDDFDAPRLDSSKWTVPTGAASFFGRTQIRPASVPLGITGGSTRLQLDTHNPWALVPGDSFLGSEIDSVDSYALTSLVLAASIVRRIRA